MVLQDRCCCGVSGLLERIVDVVRRRHAVGRRGCSVHKCASVAPSSDGAREVCASLSDRDDRPAPFVSRQI